MEKRALKSTVITALAVVPDRVTTKLKYSALLFLSNVTLPIDEQTFRLNSIYDPDQSGSGHQPTGHDQWAAFFGVYRVLSCHFRFEFMPGGLATVGYLPTRDTSTLTNSTFATEDARSGWHMGQPNAPTVVLERTFDIAALFGVSKEQYGSAEYSSSFGSNPQREFYLKLFSETAQGPAHGYSGGGYLTLEYTVEMFERVEVSPSLSQEVMTPHKTAPCSCKSCVTSSHALPTAPRKI